MTQLSYIGRFAPTPSGSLHTGSIITAVATYIIAKQNNGKCLLRIEDLDKDRCKDEYCENILRDLDKLGFIFDGEVLTQSKDTQIYIDSCNYLLEHNYAFYCKCTRAELKTRPCSCYLHKYKKDEHTSLRFYPKDGYEDTFCDAIFKDYKVNLNLQNYYTLIRSDGVISYNLACVVDDIRQHVNHIVRGADLLDLTPLQNALYLAFKKERPHYTHIPLAINANGDKLSKQNHSKPLLDILSPKDSLLFCLKALNQDIDKLKSYTKCQDLLKGACDIFDIKRINRENIVVDKNFF